MSPIITLLAIAAAAAVVWGLLQIAAALRGVRDEARQGRTFQIMAAFAPGVAAVADEPKALLSWQPLALTARRLFPDEFAALDRAAGGTFPFSAAQIEQAHARWTTDWLAWEQAHDNTYKLKAAQTGAALSMGAASPADRAELDAIEREKLERYQARYSEYIRVAKGLQALMPRPGA